MSFGPGKYDSVCTQARVASGARGCVVIVFDGKQGSGFSVQSSDPDLVKDLPALLRGIAAQIESDLQVSAALKDRMERPSDVLGVLATVANADQGGDFSLAVGSIANLIQRRSLTFHYTLFAQDLEQFLEMARLHDATIQKINRAADAETYELLHQGAAEPWTPSKEAQ